MNVVELHPRRVNILKRYLVSCVGILMMIGIVVVSSPVFATPSAPTCTVPDQVLGAWQSSDSTMPAQTIVWSRDAQGVRLVSIPAHTMVLNLTILNGSLCTLQSALSNTEQHYHVEYVTNDHLVLRDESGNSVVYDRLSSGPGQPLPRNPSSRHRD